MSCPPMISRIAITYLRRVLVGAAPDRLPWDGDTVDIDTYFAMARGLQRNP